MKTLPLSLPLPLALLASPALAHDITMPHAHTMDIVGMVVIGVAVLAAAYVLFKRSA